MNGEQQPLPGVEEYVALVNRYLDRGLTDGWPIIPPSNQALEPMLAAGGRPGEDVLGQFAYRASPVKVKDVAVNALMAGCKPDYMPVVLAALEILIDPAFSTQGWGASSNTFLPWIIINGPILTTLAINCGTGVFGPGFRANATIGRAIRLCLINLAGLSPAQRDCGTMGNAYKFTCVMGEDEEHNHWAPLHTEFGFQPGDSTVAVQVTRHPRHISHMLSDRPEQFLGALAEELSTHERATSSNRPLPADEAFEEQPRRGRGVIVLGRDHRDALHRAGWDKTRVKAFLQRSAGRRPADWQGPVRDFALLQPDAPDPAWSPIYRSPDDFLVIGAGGGGPCSVAASGSAFGIRKIAPPAARSITVSSQATSQSPLSAIVDAVNDHLDGGQSDGVPIIPHSEESVAAMVAASGRDAGDPLGVFEGGQVVTVRSVAVQAVMAGCLPGYAPVVLAAIEGLLEPAMRSIPLGGLASLTPWVVVNGPISRELGINSGRGAFGPGFRPNATIGRAIRLCLMNLGGYRVGQREHGTFGQAYQYTSGVVAEDELNSPWQPLHLDRGFEPDDSTVSVLLCKHARQTSQMGTMQPAVFLQALADDMSSVQNFDRATETVDTPPDASPRFVVALCGDHRAYLRDNNWTKRQVQEYFLQRVGRTTGEIRARGYDDSRWIRPEQPDSDFIPLARRAEDFLVLATGGGGSHSLSCAVVNMVVRPVRR